MVLLEWRGKQLKVSNKQVAVIKDFALKKSLKTKDFNDGGKTYKNKDGVEAGTISFTLGIFRQLGLEVQAELNDWMAKMEDGERGALTLAGVNLLGDEVILKGVEASKFVTRRSKLVQCEVKLSFEASKLEPAPPAPAAGGGGSRSRRSKSKATGITLSGGGALPKTGAAHRALAQARAANAAKNGKSFTKGNLTGLYGNQTSQ